MFFFYSVAQEWDALHLYIANNIDWMNVWIERCKHHNGGRLSWQRLSELVREARHNGGFLDSNLTDTPTFFHHQFIM
jgi:hypothetical protein